MVYDSVPWVCTMSTCGPSAGSSSESPSDMSAAGSISNEVALSMSRSLYIVASRISGVSSGTGDGEGSTSLSVIVGAAV